LAASSQRQQDGTTPVAGSQQTAGIEASNSEGEIEAAAS